MPSTIIAFVLTDDYNALAISRQEGGGLEIEDCGYMGEHFMAQDPRLEGLGELLRELFPSTPALEEEPVAGAISEAELMPDLEMLGGDGDPGDRILPEELVSTGDPVEDEGLVEDVLDLYREQDAGFPSIDGEVYAAYFVDAMRNSRNPYGSRNRFAGVSPEFTCARRNCENCRAKAGLVLDVLGSEIEFDTPCRRAWERHPVAWDDSHITSLPAFFQVVAVLPRWARNTWKNIRTRYGRVTRIQMKDAPYVVVRWGDLDDEGRFVPGIVDERTGERRDRYSIMPAWALYNVRTGERFKYQEPTVPVQLNRPFRARVFREVRRRWPDYWKRIIQPRQVGIRWWRVDETTDGYLVRLALNDKRVLTYRILHDLSGAGAATPYSTFATQAVMWRLVEKEMAGATA